MVSEETVTAVPMLPTLTSPGRTLVVPLDPRTCPAEDMGKASAPHGPHVLDLLRAQLTLPWEVRALSCTPFSGQTQGDGPRMWLPSPEPAS